MKRIVDEPYTAYAVSVSDIYVKCPKCGGPGIVMADEKNACFKCTNCGNSATKERTAYRYDIHSQCRACGRYYNVEIRRNYGYSQGSDFKIHR